MESDSEPRPDDFAVAHSSSTRDSRRRGRSSLTDEEFVEMLNRRTGRSHAHWLRELAVLRAVSRTPTRAESKEFRKPGPGSPTA